MASFAQKIIDRHPTTACKSCDVLLAPINITCKDGRSAVEHPHLKLSAGQTIDWSTDSQRAWIVVFPHAPWERNTFDPSYPALEITGVEPGKYTYIVCCEGCARAGEGALTVVAPDTE